MDPTGNDELTPASNVSMLRQLLSDNISEKEFYRLNAYKLREALQEAFLILYRDVNTRDLQTTEWVAGILEQTKMELPCFISGVNKNEDDRIRQKEPEGHKNEQAYFYGRWEKKERN